MLLINEFCLKIVLPGIVSHTNLGRSGSATDAAGNIAKRIRGDASSDATVTSFMLDPD